MNTTRILFAMIWNRLSAAEETFPKYIGEFDGIDSLPRGEYPPIYSWLDRTRPGSVILSINTPLLEKICRQEAERADLEVDDRTIGEALDFLKEVSYRAFGKVLEDFSTEG